MIRLLLKVGKLEEALEIYHEIVKDGLELEPNSQIYDLFLYKYWLANNTQQTKYFVDLVKRKGIQSQIFKKKLFYQFDYSVVEKLVWAYELYEVDPFVWHCIMNHHSKTNQLSSLLETFEKMKRAGVKRDIYMWGVVLTCSVHAKKEHIVVKLLEEFQEEGLTPNTSVWTVKLKLYLLQDKLQEASNIFDLLENTGRMQEVSWMHLVSFCGEVCPRYFEDLVRRMKPYVDPSDVEINNRIFFYYTKIGSLEEVLRAWGELNKLTSPILLSYNLFIKVLVKFRDEKRIEECLESMRKANIAPDHTTNQILSPAFSHLLSISAPIKNKRA
uniref:Pentacotripeptide-repeat region of PRORP domain-containing protein n=1 Tax=Arcella intermedia TaxID=1963864 RepID=A0A6B2LAA4_9EUKA